MPERRRTSIPTGVVIGGVALVMLAGGIVAMRGRGGAEPSSSAASADSASPSLETLLAGSASPVPGTSGAPPRGDMLKQATLADAIGVARPAMTNTAGRLDSGSALLALWASDRLTWDALSALPETTPALFRKDPEAERGKRLCMSGTIVEIRAEKSLASRLTEDRASPLIARATPLSGTDSTGAPAVSAETPQVPAFGLDLIGTQSDWAVPNDGKVFVAFVKEKPEPIPEGTSGRELRRAVDKDLLIVEVVAVKSTGTLVDGSDARVCGVLTGVTQVASSSTAIPADATVHRIVGMFDLPQNHGGAPEIAHQGG